MVSDIQSKLTAPNAAWGEVTVPATKAAASTAAPEAEKVSHITPIPKAEVQFDLETMHKNLADAIQKLNDMMKDSGRTLSFSMDVKLGQPIVFVKNMATGEVVRQIPSDVVVRVAHGIEDFKGLLHNKSI